MNRAPLGAVLQYVLSTPLAPAALIGTESVPLEIPHRMNPVPRYTPIGWPVIATWRLKSPITTYCNPTGSFCTRLRLRAHCNPTSHP